MFETLGVRRGQRDAVMKARVVVVATTLALYVAILGAAPVLDRLTLFPSTRPIDARMATRRTLALEGGELEIWSALSRRAHDSGNPQLFVLRFYGNADRAERWAALEAGMFGDRSVEIWGVNYPGFGGSTGPARLARSGPAALAAFDAIKTKAGTRPVVIFGTSMGTTAALHVSAQREVDGLILQNPPALREMILRQFGWWNLWLLAGPLSLKVPAALDSIANAKASHAPAVFLLAEKDEVVAPKFQKLVTEAYSGEKRIISLPGATHNASIELADLARLHTGLDWLISARAN